MYTSPCQDFDPARDKVVLSVSLAESGLGKEENSMNIQIDSEHNFKSCTHYNNVT